MAWILAALCLLLAGGWARDAWRLRRLMVAVNALAARCVTLKEGVDQIRLEKDFYLRCAPPNLIGDFDVAVDLRA